MNKDIELYAEDIKKAMDIQWDPSEKDVLNGLQHPSAIVRKLYAERKDYDITPAIIDVMLNSSDPFVVASLATRKVTDKDIPAEKYYELIKHENRDVAFPWILKKTHPITPELMDWAVSYENDNRVEWFLRVSNEEMQDKYLSDTAFKEKGLQNSLSEVKIFFAGIMTEKEVQAEHVERGLSDPDPKVRYAWYSHPYSTITEEQWKHGMFEDDDLRIRVYCAQQDQVPLETEEWEKGLSDPSEYVRFAFAIRADAKPTDSQVERGMQDSSSLVRSVFIERHAKTIDPELRDSIVQGEDYELLRGLMARKDFEFKPEEVRRGMQSTHDGIRKLWSHAPVHVLDADTIQKGLMDKDRTVQRNMIASLADMYDEITGMEL